MTQFNFGTIVASTKSGSGLAADLNAWRDALHTNHKGPTRPTYVKSGLGWIKDVDSPWEDYVYDGVADALRGFIDPATHRYSTAGNFARTITSGGVTARLADWGSLFNLSGPAAQTVAIETKASLLAGWWIRVIAQSVAVTIDPFGAETIDGLGTLILSAGSSISIFYDGSTFWSDANGGGASAFPVGGVVYVPSANPPTGFVRLNGVVLSRVTYAGLWGFAQASGNIAATDAAWTEGKFSPGDGSTTFRIPDQRGKFIRAWDNSRGVDASRLIGTSQTDEFQSHAHTASAAAGGDHQHILNASTSATGNHSHQVPMGTGGSGSGGSDTDGNAPISFYVTSSIAGNHAHVTNAWTDVRGNHGHGITVNAAGAAETRPQNIALLACIKY